MQISRDLLSNASMVTFMDRRHDFLTSVIIDVKVIGAESDDIQPMGDRSAAMAELDRLLREVGCFLGR